MDTNWCELNYDSIIYYANQDVNVGWFDRYRMFRVQLEKPTNSYCSYSYYDTYWRNVNG